MKGRQCVVHPQLHVGRQGGLANGERLLLRQGENDMACGHHCVLMALMLLGQVTREGLHEDILEERLGEVCERGQARYFSGCTVADLKDQLSVFGDKVACREIRRDVAERTVAALQSGHTCLVQITSPSYTHWMLAVGVMYVDDEAHTLLALDPLMEKIHLTPWNALLENWGSKRLRNTNARWSEKAVVEKVVQVGLRAEFGLRHAMRAS
jgi:hypothetical protein